MSKTFSLQEATTLLPVLEALLKRARAAATRGADLDLEMRQLSHKIFLAGGTHVNVAVAARRRAERDKASQETKDTVAEIEAIGVTVQDLEAGLLDFPSQKDGRAVLLCWKLGESSIGHWRGVEDGVDERRPLDGQFGKSDRERLN